MVSLYVTGYEKPTVVTKFKKSILFGNPVVLTGQRRLPFVL